MPAELIESFIAIIRKAIGFIATIDDLTDVKTRLNDADSKILVLEERVAQLSKKFLD